MDQRLLTVETSVEDLLSGHYAFSIPPFQRDYAWSRKEALELLDDIEQALEAMQRDGTDTPYFLGTMLFVANNHSNESHEHSAFSVDVIDGQQRLITLAILFAVLRDINDDPVEKDALDALIAARRPAAYPYQLRIKGADEKFFADAILAPGAARKGQRGEVIGSDAGRRNIERNRSSLHHRLLRQTTREQRAAIAKFAREQTRVLVVTTDDFDYAYQIFLTINDRGKRLTVEDIFRGEILGPLDVDQRRRFSRVVEEMDRYMDAEEKSRGRGKTFFTHLAAAYGWADKKIVTGLRRAVEARGGPRRFAAEVFSPMAEAYLAIKSAGASLPADTFSDEVRHWLTALAWLERYGDDDWIGVAMVGLARLDRTGPALPRFLRALDRFAHGLLTLGCGRAARQKLYAPVLRALAVETMPADPASLLELSKSDEAFIVKSMATRLHERDPQLARLVLIRLDAEISGRPLAHYAPLLDPSVPRSARLTVEHVLPQGGVPEDGRWAALFPRKLRRPAIAQCIGNLVLVSEAINREADQLEFSAKKRIYFGESVSPHALALTDELRAVEEWTEDVVKLRYARLTEALRKLWGFEGMMPTYPGGE